MDIGGGTDHQSVRIDRVQAECRSAAMMSQQTTRRLEHKENLEENFGSDKTGAARNLGLLACEQTRLRGDAPPYRSRPMHQQPGP